ncbi:MAG: zinc-ribbon domain-containing protein [Oscillospiraceae bacterium]|nr:zinc-ribbon domain-containing protein [Oscillospiraceae bacterium]
MYCSNCGKEIPAESKFCKECGNKVIASTVVNDNPTPEINPDIPVQQENLNDSIADNMTESVIPQQDTNVTEPQHKKLFKALGILRFIDAGLWLLVALFQIGLYVMGTYEDTLIPFPLLVGWNIVCITLCIKFGIDLLKGNRLINNIQLCVISLLFYGFQFIVGTYAIIFFILLEIAILVISVIARGGQNTEKRKFTTISIICGVYIVVLLFAMNIYTNVFNRETYVNMTEGFSFKYTSIWEIANTDENTIVSIAEPPISNSPAFINVTKYPKDSAYFTATKSDFQASYSEFLNNVQITDLRNVNLDGITARKISCNATTQNGVECKFIQYYYVIGADMYVVTCSTSYNSSHIFDNIMSSYKILRR